MMARQKVVVAAPPMFDAIDAVFKVKGKPMLFAYGDTIFNPMGVTIAPELFDHEAVHGVRHGAAPQAWWANYLIDATFRLAEELPAHIAEFKALCRLHRHGWTSARNMRRYYADHVARKLAAPLYGSLISKAKAMDLILAG